MTTSSKSNQDQTPTHVDEPHDPREEFILMMTDLGAIVLYNMGHLSLEEAIKIHKTESEEEFESN